MSSAKRRAPLPHLPLRHTNDRLITNLVCNVNNRKRGEIKLPLGICPQLITNATCESSNFQKLTGREVPVSKNAQFVLRLEGSM